MNKYKVYVYAICKNESHHIERWVDSMKEADGIYVLDTGSTDDSVEKLKSLGVNVEIKKYEHFKFDEARNDSLDLVPQDADICVCTDLDEILNKNWREELESIWKENTDRIRYNLYFTFDEEGNPLSSYYISKIHKRNKYTWTHPIHEVLAYVGTTKENVLTSETITISHLPDRTKDRSFYLNLLEESVKDNPDDDRNMHYLGREYMYNEDWNNSINTLIKHLNLQSSTWNEERGASMRFISRGYIGLKRYDEAEMWLKKAIDETPNVREPYIELGLLYYNLEKYEDAVTNLEKGINIKEKSPTYINEEFAWNETPYDILSICYYQLGKYEEALKNSEIAININKNNDRLKNNYYLIKETIKNI